MLKSIFRLFVASLCVMPPAFCVSGAEVARVGEAVITAETLRQTVARNGYNIYDADSVKKGLEDAVQFELLAAEAKKLGVQNQPDVARQIKELLVQKLLEEKVDAPLNALHFSDEELKAWYEAHTNAFTRAALARGNVLTIFMESGREAEARARAAEALKELEDATETRIGGGQSGWTQSPSELSLASGSSERVAAIVRKYSDDPGEKLNGGLSNYFVDGQQSRRYPQAVADAMFQLKLRGEIGGPIATPRALYLIRLTERREAQLRPFEQAKSEVQKRLIRERRQKALAEYCEELKKEFPITINESALEKAVQASKSSAGPPSVPGLTP